MNLHTQETNLKLMLLAQRILAPYMHPEKIKGAPSQYYMEVSDMNNKLKQVYVSASVYKDLTSKTRVGSVFEFPWRMTDRNFVFYGVGSNPQVAVKARLISKKGREEVAQYIRAHGGTIADATKATEDLLQKEAEDEGDDMPASTLSDLPTAKVLVVTKDPRTNEVNIRKDGITLTQAQSTDILKQITETDTIIPDMEIRNLTVDKVIQTRSELVITLVRK